MRVPLSWLRAFTPIEVTADVLAERLSLTGLTVDTIERPGRDISNVIVADVRAIREHPDADKLMLVRAFDGERERDIVCGARNYAVGDRVPLAVPGGTLPGGMEIAERKVRGERSEGMLCSARELGLGADHAGIMILSPDAAPGSDLVKTLELDDEVLVIDVLPNRPDALSILGVAREVAALYRLPLSFPPVELAERGEPTTITVEVVDAEGCPTYTARTIRGVTAGGASPWWLRRRLILAGMRPIDPIVDATNHTMLEVGQPLHAFDLSTIRGGRIIVRGARPGEELVTLDGQTRALEPGDLLICDAERPVALAGVMGGADTEVGPGTKDILLESAAFDALRIARTSRRLDLRSEAAQRFERGVDPAGVTRASDRCASLIASLTGGTVSPGIVSAGPGASPAPRIAVTVDGLSARLGVALAEAEVRSSLEAIGCHVAAAAERLEVTPPSWRPDITQSEDVEEEVARIYGYDRIPETLPSGGRTGGLTPRQHARRRVQDAVRAAGCNEAVTLSLLSPSFPDKLDLPADHPWRETIAVANPLSEEESQLRSWLLPGLLEAARRNAVRRVLPVKMFEIGVVFARHGSEVHEELRIAAVLTGETQDGWDQKRRSLDAFDARHLVDAIGSELGLTLRIEQDAPPAPFHPARSARVMLGDRDVGGFGELHPGAADALDLPAHVAVLELQLDVLCAADSPMRAPEVPKFPSLDRDFGVVVPSAESSSAVAAAIRDAAGPLLESATLFDVYRGESLVADQVSLAFTLRLRAPDRTLTDAEAATIMASIEAAAAARAWTVRI